MMATRSTDLDEMANFSRIRAGHPSCPENGHESSAPPHLPVNSPFLVAPTAYYDSAWRYGRLVVALRTAFSPPRASPARARFAPLPPSPSRPSSRPQPTMRYHAGAHPRASRDRREVRRSASRARPRPGCHPPRARARGAPRDPRRTKRRRAPDAALLRWPGRSRRPPSRPVIEQGRRAQRRADRGGRRSPQGRAQARRPRPRHGRLAQAAPVELGEDRPARPAAKSPQAHSHYQQENDDGRARRVPVPSHAGKEPRREYDEGAPGHEHPRPPVEGADPPISAGRGSLIGHRSRSAVLAPRRPG